jgi:hypothetical protein
MVKCGVLFEVRTYISFRRASASEGKTESELTKVTNQLNARVLNTTNIKAHRWTVF